MNVGDIISEVRELLPNSLSDASLIRKMNNLQNQLYRNEFRRTALTQYDILANVPAYPLGFSSNKVKDLLVNGEEYRYKDTQGEGASRFYYFIGDDVGLYPVPDTDISGGLLVFHDAEPDQLTATSQIPDLDKDFHMLLVYGTCVQIAEAMLATELINGFTGKYNDLLGSLLTSQRVPDFPRIQNLYEGLM
ncbi:phage adaptor protein [Gorillibacterium timonense]|uniref:phage adaptor protein n=1 Tax=Gorillibacterium timonense TaxID=1689269 RepID=UPI00071D3C63|nr:hypothetical protein [Gorillibacterium timonense]